MHACGEERIAGRAHREGARGGIAAHSCFEAEAEAGNFVEEEFRADKSATLEFAALVIHVRNSNAHVKNQVRLGEYVLEALKADRRVRVGGARVEADPEANGCSLVHIV